MNRTPNKLQRLLIKGWNQFPYFTWLLVLGILLAFTIVAYQAEVNEQSKEQVHRRIEKDVQSRWEQIEADRKAGKFELFYRRKLPSTYFSRYHLYVLSAGNLEAWSSNKISLPDSLIKAPDKIGQGRVMQIGYETYYVQHWHLLSYKKSNQKSFTALTFIP